MFNIISNSKQTEGIFIVEGEKDLLVKDNQVENNQVGIMLLNSDGLIMGNRVDHNNTGVFSMGRSNAKLIGNSL